VDVCKSRPLPRGAHGPPIVQERQRRRHARFTLEHPDSERCSLERTSARPPFRRRNACPSAGRTWMCDVPRRRSVHELPLTLKTHACGSGHRIPNPKPLAQAVVKEREARTASHRHICETAASSSKKKEDGSQNPKIKNHKNKRLLQRPEIGAQTQRAHRYRRGIRPLPTHPRGSSTGSSVADYASQPEI